MPQTAKRFGLIVNDSVDERRDPYRSTLAAIEYLKLLHRKFPYWYLAIAAYNCGEGRVERAMQKHGTGDFFKLCEEEALPEETCDYVPRILAAAIVDKNPSLFGVPGADRKDKAAPTKLMIANRGANVQQLADAAELKLEKFQEYNPHLLTESIDIESAENPNLPATPHKRFVTAKTYEAWIRIAFQVAEPWTQQSDPNATLLMSHTIKNPLFMWSKESLSSIADQHGLALSKLKAWNPQMQTVSPGDEFKITAPRKKKMIQHTIKPGDTLRKLAKKYDCTVDEIMAWNNLSEAKIPPRVQRSTSQPGKPQRNRLSQS